jgi:hypothetical protein
LKQLLGWLFAAHGNSLSTPKWTAKPWYEPVIGEKLEKITENHLRCGSQSDVKHLSVSTRNNGFGIDVVAFYHYVKGRIRHIGWE